MMALAGLVVITSRGPDRVIVEVIILPTDTSNLNKYFFKYN